MRDANLQRVRAEQTALEVGLLGIASLGEGTSTNRAALDAAPATGKQILIADARTQDTLERGASGDLVEATFAAVACLLQDHGFSGVISAGAETSGAEIITLGVRMLDSGTEIDPGVPWTRILVGPALTLALKSGTFGASDFVLRAWSLLTLDTAA